MRISQAGLDVIKTFEGFRPRYEKLQKGFWIGGFGHVTREPSEADLSEAEAETILREYDLPPYENLVQDTVLAPLNQSEFDALVSFAFNIGAKTFVTSNVVIELNSGNRVKAALGFDDWDHAKIGGHIQTIDALVRRRALEKALFLTPPPNMPGASSRLYRVVSGAASVATPIKSREIVFENVPALEAPNQQEGQKIEDELSPTQAAVAAVRRQMVRILGEDDSVKMPDSESSEIVATPDEITAAVSELVSEGLQDKDPIAKSVWPTRQDLSDVTKYDDVAFPSSESSATIDDFETVEISQADIDRAISENAAMLRKDRSERKNNPFLSWIFAFVGLCLIAAGLVGYAVNETGNVGVSAVYTAPVLIFIGWMILSVIGFQAYRSSLDED